MDELGDYLYLIFIGIAIVSSLFSRKKKKEAQKAAENPAPSTHWQEVLKEMTQEQEPIPQYEPIVAEVAQPYQNMFVKEMVAGTNFTSEGGRSITHKASAEVFVEESQSPINLDFDDGEELKRAIIYSEILGRKY